MSVVYVSVAGGGDGSSTSSRWTLAQANAGAVSGDVVQMAPGTYTTSINPSANNVTYQGESLSVIIATTSNDMARLEGQSGITLDTMTLFSVGHSWIWSDALSDNLTLTNITFDSDDPPGGPWAAGNDFTGITLPGDDCLIQNCRLLQWLGGDGVSSTGLRLRVVDSYFGESGHGTLYAAGDYYVVQRCYFRNKWARGANFSPNSSDTGDQLNGLVEDCIFFDCNYIDTANEGDPAKGWVANVDADGPGDEQAVGKAGGSRLIFRNNLVVRSHTTQNAANTYRADCQIGNYADSPYWRQIRAYHNTHLDGEVHPWSITYRSAGNMDARDNRFLNNIWYPIATDGLGIDNVGFWFNVAAANDGSGSYNFMDTWQFHGNVNPRGWRYSGSTRTVAQFEALFPTSATNNLSGTPAFVDTDTSAAVADLDLEITRENFALATGSVGENAAVPLATIAANSSGTTLTVGNGEAWFFTDGNSLIPGDSILVNGQTTTVTAIPTSSTLTISPAINASIGNAVWLATYGATPDVGIHVTADEEPPAGMTVELLDVVSGSVSSASVTSTSVSINAGDLLIIAISANNAVSGALGTPFTISDTFSEALTWAKVEINRSAGSGTCVGFFTAVATQPGSGTVTITFANNCHNKVLYTMRVPDNFDSTVPVVQSKTYTGSNSSPTTVTFTDAPQASSLIIAILGTRGTTGPYTFNADSGYTELSEQQPSTSHGSQVQYIEAGGDSTVAWTGSFGGTGVAAIVLEIAAAETLVPFTATGAPTVPAFTAGGVGDVSDPIYAGNATVTLPTLSATGDALFDAGTFAATGTAVLPALAVDGAAMHSDPVFDATGAATLAALTAIGLVDYDDPVFAAVGIGTLLGMDASGSASFDAGTFVTTGATELPFLTAMGSALFDAGTFTGAGTGTLGALTATGTADQVDPVFSANASVALGALVATGIAEYSDVSFAANGAPSLASLDATGAATHIVPIFAANGAGILGDLDTFGVAQHVAPLFAANGAGILGNLSAFASAEFNTIILTATAALVLPVLDAVGSATHTAPVFAATGPLSLSVLAASGLAEVDVPVHSASGALSLGSFDASGSASFAAGTFTSSGAGQVHVLDATGLATHVAPIFISAGAPTLPLLDASGSATYGAPIRTASGALLLSVTTASGMASYAPLSQAASNMVLPALVGVAVGVISPPPPARFVSQAIVQI